MTSVRDGSDAEELQRLIEVMRTLRQQCPWDAEQTHRSLMQYLIEETCEVVEAIETMEVGAPDHDHLREELGDLLLQVIFHATIAGETEPEFSVGVVARGVADKLIARHPYVFADGDTPDDVYASWEQRKAAEKGRRSVLEGIPEQLSVLHRANKIITRARSRAVAVELPEAPDALTAAEIGEQLITLVSQAQALGIDPDQAARDAVRRLEDRVTDAERQSAATRADSEEIGARR